MTSSSTRISTSSTAATSGDKDSPSTPPLRLLFLFPSPFLLEEYVGREGVFSSAQAGAVAQPSIAQKSHAQSSITCLSVRTFNTTDPVATTYAFSFPPLPTFVAHLDTAKRGPRPVQVFVSVQPAHLLPLTPLNCQALAGLEWSGRIRWDGETAFTPVQAGAVAQQSHIKSSIILLA